MLVDTGALVGRYLPADQHHIPAVEGWRRIKEERLTFYISTLVLSETLTLLGRFAGNRFAAETGRLILALPPTRILRPEPKDELQAVEWMEKFADQGVSFCDCVSFVLMRRLGLRRVFGFDRHFESAGFQLWPAGIKDTRPSS